MAREIRTRTTIETESISVIACRQVSHVGCERCGAEVEMPTAGTAGALIESLPEAFPKRMHQEGSWNRARRGLVMSLKSLLRFLESTNTRPRS